MSDILELRRCDETLLFTGETLARDLLRERSGPELVLRVWFRLTRPDLVFGVGLLACRPLRPAVEVW